MEWRPTPHLLLTPRSLSAHVKCLLCPKDERCVITSYSLLIGFSPTLGDGNGTPLQYFCLENPMEGEAWWAAVHRITKSRT